MAAGDGSASTARSGSANADSPTLDASEASRIAIASAKVRAAILKALGNGSVLSMNDRDGDRHLLLSFSHLEVDCGDLQIEGTVRTNAKAGTASIQSSKPIVLTMKATGHNADQATAPSSTFTITIQSLSASIQDGQPFVDVTVPMKVANDRLVVVFTDARHRKVLGHRTTTRAWAGPLPFTIELDLVVRVELGDDASSLRLRLLHWSPRSHDQAINVGGWIRLPSLLQGTAPSIAGQIRPLDATSVSVSIEGFGHRTIPNPLTSLMDALKTLPIFVKP